ncbi:RNA polymerase sigma factor [Nocardioides marmorisolisilvae]|uniref:RNA polymerase sigma factor n=1 Tax=Nocardioides marmorisolisilvae TaxID=1542737 RepID=A0A3N0DTZ5_9ACTN|nr:RNA polymerase sigma factor [Nocardioides marmorisolisilvae]RNL78863.1 RNA polymerase sigma factor [Nocardioides marmorisolisilvae]
MTFDDEITQIVRAEHGRVVAQLIRRLGDIDLAEDAVAEALITALEKWPVDGIPPNPGAWLTTTAGNKAIDRIRREGKRDAKHQEALMIEDDTPHEPTGPVEDDRLRLIFTCCHPALAPENRIALTLRLLGGLTVGEIAAAFLVPETTMGQRITRSKQKIKAANIPYRVPAEEDLVERLGGVLSVLYLIFNEGYLSSGPAMRVDLAEEAIRLTRQLTTLIENPEVDGLLALMLLTEARRPARVSDGVLVTLEKQDRAQWDSALIDEGHTLVRRCLTANRPGPFQIQAAINAVHTDALDASMTDWSQIVKLYDQLVILTPSPIVELNRAVAVAELDGPEVALAIVDRLELTGYHPFHVTRAELLRRLDRTDEARAAYDAALGLAENEAEQAHLTGRRDSLTR